MLGLALGTRPIVTLVAPLAATFLVALAGVAVLAAAHQALELTFSGRFRFGAIVAFVVAAPPIEVLGISSGCWAIPVGFVASLATERSELLAHWRGAEVAA